MSPITNEKDVQVTSPASSALAQEAGLDGCAVAWLTGGFRARRRWA
jgi:hypothetical protein